MLVNVWQIFTIFKEMVYALSKTTNVTVKFVRTWQIGKLAKLFALNQ